MNTARDSRFLKIGETAKLLGLSSETLRRWERAGKISFPRTPGGKRLFSEADLEAIRNLLKPTHPQILSQDTKAEQVPIESAQTYTTEKPIHPVRKEISNGTQPKKQIPMGKLVNLFVYLAFFALVMSNLPAVNTPDLRGKVLGVETAIIAEGSAVVQTFLTRATSLIKSINPPSINIPKIVIPQVSFPSSQFPFLALFIDSSEIENQTQEDLKARIEVLENSIKTLSQPTSSQEPISGSLTLTKLTTSELLATTINTNTLDSSKLVFSGDAPSIYPSTKNSKISLNASGTGAINIGDGSTGDIYLGGGSGDSGCTLTNNNGTFNCSGNITSAGDLIANGGDILTDQTTLNIGSSTQTVRVPGTLKIGTGTTTIDTSSVTTGTITGTAITSSGQVTLTRAPSSVHTGTWAINSSTWNVSDSTLYLNPSSVTADTNILGIAVGGSVKFDVDAEGDIYGNNLVLAGNTTTSSTTVSADLTVEGNTTLGDATTDTLTINPATLTWAGGNKTLDITGAATRTLTILNSTASQVADLDISDGSLKTGGTARLGNSGNLSNIGTISLSGQLTSTLATGTAPFSVSSTTNVANLNASTLSGATFASPGSIGSTTAGTGAFTTLSASSTLTASNGLTLTTGALSLTGTSGSIALTGFGTTAITSTTTSGDILAVTDTSLTAASSNLANFTFKNNNTGAGVAVSGVTITEQAAGTPSSGTNTSNLLNLAAAAGGTVNGINISSATGFTNFFKTPTFNLDSAGAISGVTTLTATTLAGTLSTASQTNVTAVGTLTSLAVTGNINSSTGSLQTNGVTRIDNSGNLTAGTGSFAGAVTPSLDATHDFGSASVRWNNAYFTGDVTAGDLVFKNNFRFTENGEVGMHILNPRGEIIGGFDFEGNLWMKGEIRQWKKN